MKNEDEALKWKLVKSEHIVHDKWVDFRREAYQLPDGRVFDPYYTYSRRSYVVIVASDEDGKFLCVRQYRQGIHEVTTEFPAGGIETPGNSADYQDREHAEHALEAAKRELKEETGCVSDDWSHLITIPSNATVADNYAFVYRAKNCHLVSGQKLDETEFLHMHRLSPDEIEDLIRHGKFQQAIHVMAWLLAKERQ
ncbi:MAG: NUDIX hydrolase [Eubacteriales bacterium]|jgi:8-oxo-dGTP pyrophosphatase MutT (NUDIX family)